MTLDRKDYKSAIPQLEGRLEQIEKLGKDAFNKFEDIAHKTQLDAAEAEKKAIALDYKMTTTRVQMEYQLCTSGQTPVEANWQTSMPSITYNSYQGKTLWYRSKTYVNDIVVQTTAPMTVNLMDGVYSFVNTVSGNTGWTTIDGDKIQTGCITSHDGNCYFDIDNNNFQMKDNSTLASSTNALAWDNGQLYIKGKIAIGNSTTDKKYYTEMTGGGFDVVANNVTLAHIGYGRAIDQSGSISDSEYPFYRFGERMIGVETGCYSVGEGYRFEASGWASHAEGAECIARGIASHAEGNESMAIGDDSHAEGYDTIARGDDSHAQNCGTIAGKDNQTAIGKYNIEDTAVNVSDQKAFIIGNGTSTVRSNALAVDWYGKLYTNQIQAGSIAGDDVASGSIRTETVTFDKAMSGTPIVVASLFSSSQYAETGSVSVGVSSISSTGFTCKIFNNSSRKLAPAVRWIAVNVGLP